jgi:hypothetical protein
MDKLTLLRKKRSENIELWPLSIQELVRANMSMQEVDALITDKMSCKCCERHQSNRYINEQRFTSKPAVSIECNCICRHDIRILQNLLLFHKW